MKITGAIIVLIIGQTFWQHLWNGAYYQSIALGLFLLFWELKSSGKIAATIGFWLSLSNLLDELLFDPKVIDWNEYVFAFLVTYLTFKRYAANSRQRQ
jgi:hypothetical protein